MASSSELLALLGKPADDPSVKSLMQAFGVKREPELDEDDEEAVTDWLPVRKAGIEFGFMTKGALKGDLGPSKYAGPLILHRIIFYCSFEGMESYPGELPHGIVKTDNRSKVAKKLARYESVRRAYIRDVWELPEHRLIVTYTEEEKSVSSVICALRPYPYSRTLSEVPPLPSMEQIIGATGALQGRSKCRIFSARFTSKITKKLYVTYSVFLIDPGLLGPAYLDINFLVHQVLSGLASRCRMITSMALK